MHTYLLKELYKSPTQQEQEHLQIKKSRNVIFKKCTQFTVCINKISNAHVDNAKDNIVVMLMYNCVECNNNDSKTSGSLWLYCKEEPIIIKTIIIIIIIIIVVLLI